MSISTHSSCCERMKFVFLEERANEKRKIILSILVAHRGKNRDNNGNTLRISISLPTSSTSRSRTRCLLNSTAETGRANKLSVGLLTDVKAGAIPRRLAIEVTSFCRPKWLHVSEVSKLARSSGADPCAPVSRYAEQSRRHHPAIVPCSLRRRSSRSDRSPFVKWRSRAGH